jgi:uncharacterized Fe-S cluster-containing protein
MEPQKKIKINKRPVFEKNKFDKKQDSLKILDNTIKKLQNRYKQFGYNDSKEEDFLNENKGSEVVLQLKNKDVSGILDAIDKYRITIIQEGKPVHYYKHAVASYYVK